MDEQSVKKDSEQAGDVDASKQQIPKELSPEDYLLNSENLLNMDQPEALTNNYFLFSPLLPVLAFTFVSLLVISFYVNQQQQVAEIRSKAQITQPSQAPVISISPSQLPTPQAGIKGPEIFIFAAGIVLALIIVIVWRRITIKKTYKQ